MDEELLFGDIVVVDEDKIGVVVKCWITSSLHRKYDIYVRMYNGIETYDGNEVRRYKVRHKYLNEEELNYQNQDDMKDLKDIKNAVSKIFKKD